MNIITQLTNVDISVFTYLNSLGTETWDGFWNIITYKFTWIPFYAMLLYVIYRHSSFRTLFYYMLAIALLILIVDQTTSLWFKNVFQRPRPSHNIDIAGIIRITGGKGGKWGFISAHASNSFAVAIFLGYHFKQIFRYSIVSFLLWAVFISYSRIYVGVHYPADLLGGALWGSLIASTMILLIEKGGIKNNFELKKLYK